MSRHVCCVRAWLPRSGLRHGGHYMLWGRGTGNQVSLVMDTQHRHLRPLATHYSWSLYDECIDGWCPRRVDKAVTSFPGEETEAQKDCSDA